MKKSLAFAFLSLAMLAGAPLHAEGNNPFKDVKIYNRPEDFETARELALQSRQERLDRLQEVVSCIQQATTMKDIEACQKKETDAMAKVRLAYCDTGVSWPVRKAPPVGKTSDGTRHEPTECEQVISGMIREHGGLKKPPAQ
ncbi:MAG: hypothetical protein HY053_03125 [Proteobacteria bacterium]|nr:hypothetical protein [Pseudomonadota bacterium]